MGKPKQRWLSEHEVLIWIDWFNEGYVANFGCLPTIYWHIHELRAVHGYGATAAFERRVPILADRGFLTIGKCSAECGSPHHIQLTEKGEEQLQLWNREGCTAHWEKSHTGKPWRDCKKFLDGIRDLVAREEVAGVGVIRLVE